MLKVGTSVFLCWLSFGICKLVAQDRFLQHAVRTDSNGIIIPWYHPDPSIAFDHTIDIVWDWWDHIRSDYNGLPYYMNHQVWNPKFNDPRGIGGDQIAMALSSFIPYYAYSGNERVKANMLFQADWYLSHGLSNEKAAWPGLPYPYNTIVYSGIYDGDMRSGKWVTQPDKAGSFAIELLRLYKMSQGYNVHENKWYLNAVIRIANTLASNIQKGNENYSPLPFKVNAVNGKAVLLRDHDFTHTWIDTAGYTTNWSATLQLWSDLIKMNQGHVKDYQSAFETLLRWMKKYPMQNNKWGPFFEDVDWWSDTQINAMTWARYIMTHTEYFPNWKTDAKKIIEWVHKMFDNDKWKEYGVVVTNEQTVYPMPGNSHSSRQGADELLYVSLTQDSTFYNNALRKLIWATYAVADDGLNRYPGDEPWMTDGYGDFIRHYLRAFDSNPDLAVGNENHILSSTSVIQQADYKGELKKFYDVAFQHLDTNAVTLYYKTYDVSGVEKLRLTRRPSGVLLDYKPMKEDTAGECFSWRGMKSGGLLTIRRLHGREVILLE